MKKVFITSILICSTFNAFCQTVEETKEFIKMKLDELKLRIEIQYPKTFNPTTLSSDVIYFDKSFMGINHTYYKHKKIESNYSGDRYEIAIDINLNEVLWVNLKNIKSIKIEKSEKIDNINMWGKIIFKGDESKPYYYDYYGENAFIKYFNFFNNATQFKETQNGINAIEIRFLNYNEENLNKLKKAFSHLIKLNGGQIIDDLF